MRFMYDCAIHHVELETVPHEIQRIYFCQSYFLTECQDARSIDRWMMKRCVIDDTNSSKIMSLANFRYFIRDVDAKAHAINL